MHTRSEISRKISKLLIKIGSQALIGSGQGVIEKHIKNICADIKKLQAKNIQILLVSSGAIALGKSLLSSQQSKPQSTRELQALAALGQPLLIDMYRKYLNHPVAQILVTHEDIRNKARSINLLNMINELLDKKIVPIINENDSVSFNEISLGDNDQLSSMIAQLCNIDLLCMLSQSDGLYDKDPSEPDAINIKKVFYKEDLKNIKMISKSIAGRGGMKTKIQAVQKLTPLGVPVVIGSFTDKNPVLRLLQSDSGTYFTAAERLKKHRLSWMQTRAKANCHINIDFGAAKALQNNASLLATGIKSIHGTFSRGDCVGIKCQNRVIAYGMVEYNSKDMERLKGLKTANFSTAINHVISKVMIHKNNLYLREA